MKQTTKITALIATLAAVANTSNAAVIAQWTFNDLTSVTTALQSSGVATGASASSLAINPTHTSFGINVLPNSTSDGYGFGGNSGENVMFIHRANFSNPNPPAAATTTWGSPTNSTGIDTTVARSALSFTITADALTTITLNSINIAAVGGAAAFLVEFQEAGAPVGADSGGTNTSATANLRSPVVIGAGQSKTFTVNLNSGAFNSAHILNTITLDGTSIPEPSTTALAGLMLAVGLLRRRRH